MRQLGTEHLATAGPMSERMAAKPTSSRHRAHPTYRLGNPDGSLVYASDMALDKVLVVDTATDEVTNLSIVDEKPNTIDLSPMGSEPLSDHLSVPQVLTHCSASGERVRLKSCPNWACSGIRDISSLSGPSARGRPEKVFS